MRHISDSGCGGLAGIPRVRRRARVSSYIQLYPACARSVTVPVVSRGWERLSAVSAAVARHCARLHRDILPGCHCRGAAALAPHASPCCLIPPPPAPAPTGLQGEGCRWHPCPCLHPRVPATTPGFFLPQLLFLPGWGSAWVTPRGMGWGCSPGPGERGRGRREFGAPREQGTGRACCP